MLLPPDHRRHVERDGGEIEAHFAALGAVFHPHAQRAVDGDQQLLALTVRVLTAHVLAGHVVDGEDAAGREGQVVLG